MPSFVAGSEAGAGFREIFFFVWRVGAAEYGIPVRKAAKLADRRRDGCEPAPFAARPTRRAAHRQARRVVLIGEILGMHERQVEEHALDRADLLIETAGERGARNSHAP